MKFFCSILALQQWSYLTSCALSWGLRGSSFNFRQSRNSCRVVKGSWVIVHLSASFQISTPTKAIRIFSGLKNWWKNQINILNSVDGIFLINKRITSNMIKAQFMWHLCVYWSGKIRSSLLISSLHVISHFQHPRHLCMAIMFEEGLHIQNKCPNCASGQADAIPLLSHHVQDIFLAT